MSDAMEHRGKQRLTLSGTDLHERFALDIRSPVTQDFYAKHKGRQTLVVCGWNVRQDIIDRLLGTQVPLTDNDGASRTQGLSDALILRTNESGLLLSRFGHSTSPIYYQSWEEGLAFSTERKALWRIGLSKPIELEPGQTLHVDAHQPQPTIRTQERTYPGVNKSRSKEELLASLRSRLRDCFNCLHSAENVGVLFSGGVDSSLAALLAKNVCRNVTLFTACGKGSHDEEFVCEAAQALEMELKVVPFDKDRVWGVLPELIYAIETTRQMDVEIALPLFVAACAARASGDRILISGQGPDELFAGYARHARLFAEMGEDALDEELRSEIQETHRVNIGRDERAIGYNGLSAFFPYLNSQFVSEALEVPSRWKISPSGIPERKVIFRELAIKMGLPETLASGPKKATQYSSGSQKILSKAVSEKVKIQRDIVSLKPDRIVQLVLDKIGIELGMPIPSMPNAELSIDLDTAHEFAQKIGETSRRQ